MAHARSRSPFKLPSAVVQHLYHHMARQVCSALAALAQETFEQLSESQLWDLARNGGWSLSPRIFLMDLLLRHGPAEHFTD